MTESVVPGEQEDTGKIGDRQEKRTADFTDFTEDKKNHGLTRINTKLEPRISRITRIFVCQEEDQYRRSRSIGNQLQGPVRKSNITASTVGQVPYRGVVD